MMKDKGVTASRPGCSPTASDLRSSQRSIPDADDPIVGHKTLRDGSHEPLRKSEAERIMAEIEAEDARRKEAIPDEETAINLLFDAQLRLKEMGWQNPIYAPKDGSPLDIIELGSTGIHRGHYEGKWPTGSWWIIDEDVWPSRPALARPAQRIEAGTGETPQEACPEGREPDPKDAPKTSDQTPHKETPNER